MVSQFSKKLKVYYESTLKNVKLGTTNTNSEFYYYVNYWCSCCIFQYCFFYNFRFYWGCIKTFQSRGVLKSNLHLVSAYHA